MMIQPRVGLPSQSNPGYMIESLWDNEVLIAAIFNCIVTAKQGTPN